MDENNNWNFPIHTSAREAFGNEFAVSPMNFISLRGHPVRGLNSLWQLLAQVYCFPKDLSTFPEDNIQKLPQTQPYVTLHGKTYSNDYPLNG